MVIYEFADIQYLGKETDPEDEYAVHSLSHSTQGLRLIPITLFLLAQNLGVH